MDTNNYKIICIVKNDSNRASEGLRHAFHEETNEFIKKNFYIDSRNFSSEFGNNTANKFLLIKQDSVKPMNGSQINSEAWDILLVCDNVDLKDIKEIPFTGETLVMYHNDPTDAKKTFEDLQKEQKIRKCKQGAHVHDPDQGYTLLLELTKAWKDNNFVHQEYNQAKEKLIKWFGLNEKLNAALELLHGSLGGTAAETNILTNGYEKFNLSQIYKKEKIEKKLEDWIKDLEGKKEDEYNITLAIVRDALLEQAGVTGEN